MDWPRNTRGVCAGRFAAPTFHTRPGSTMSSSRWAYPNTSNSISSRWHCYTAPDDTTALPTTSKGSLDKRRQRLVIMLPNAPNCSANSASMCGSGSAVLDLVEGHAAVGGVFAGESQYSFANYVARHLSCTAAERSGLSRQIALADEHQAGGSVHHARATGDRQCGVDLERHFLGLEKPDQRAAGRGE